MDARLAKVNLDTSISDAPIVVAVGPGGLVDGKEVKMIVKPGDKIICSKYMGTDVKVDGEQYTIVKQSDILAVIE